MSYISCLILKCYGFLAWLLLMAIVLGVEVALLLRILCG